MLSVDDSRLEPLREQALVARVSGTCPCGCPTIDLAIDRGRASPAIGLAYDAINAHSARYEDPEARDLILSVEDGWMSSLEVVWYGDKPALEFHRSPTWNNLA
jgi:hypothetical protein